MSGLLVVFSAVIWPKRCPLTKWVAMAERGQGNGNAAAGDHAQWQWERAATWTIRPGDREGWKRLAKDELTGILRASDGLDAPAEFRTFPPDAERPLLRVLRIVRELGCRTVVVESRYVDPDYRSEYANYWAALFENRPAFARRLHFFRQQLTDDDLHRLPPANKLGYLGYTVLRPNPFGPVGRTVIAPPAHYNKANLALVDDEVQLLGQPLTVRGAPFCQQDGEFLRCAHAAAWMCHYAAYRRGLTGRRLTAAFTDIAPRTLAFERRTPSKGMNPFELHAVFDEFGVPAHVIDFKYLPDVAGVPITPEPERDSAGNLPPSGMWDRRIFSLACRYLNSGLPILVAVDAEHAFSLVGWINRDDEIRFIAHDDVHGPYLEVKSPFIDAKQRGVWQMYMIPLPTKAYIPAETAENFAHGFFSRLASRADTVSSAEVGRQVTGRVYNLRTRLIDGSAYRRRAADRGMPEGLVRLLRHAHYSHYVWVVEAHDPNLCVQGGPCVVAEIVYDSTSETKGPRQCALLLPGEATTALPRASAKVEAKPWRTLLDSCGTYGEAASCNPTRLNR
jgi:hypothetical protein